MVDVTATQFQQDVNNTADWSNGDENTTVTMRLGQTARSPAKVINDVQIQADNEINELSKNFNLTDAGFDFSAGGELTSRNQLAKDGSGNYWQWQGSFPHTVSPATVPSSPDWEIRVFSDHATLSNTDTENSHPASAISLAVKDAISPNPVNLQDTIDWHGVFIEEFREVGDSDSAVIIKALTYISGLPYAGTKLIFERGREYVYDSTHYLYEINNLHIDLNGATLKRQNGLLTSSTTVNEETVDSNTTYELADASMFKVGDYVTAFTDNTDANTNRDPRRVIGVSGNTITIFAPFFFSPTKVTLPVGTRVAKVITAFQGRPSSTDSTSPLTPGVNSRIFITNGTIDGNKSQQINNSWRFIVEIGLHSKGGLIGRNEFKNIAGESIVGHGINVDDNVFEDLDGSCFHTSANDQTLDDIGWSRFTNNTVKRVNQAGYDALGHSEGMITFSWGAGNLIISDNICKDGVEYVIGGFGPASGANPDRLLILSDNIFENFKGIADEVSASAEGVHIADNVFANILLEVKTNELIERLIANQTCTWSNNTFTGSTSSNYEDYESSKKYFVGTDISKVNSSTSVYKQANTVTYSQSLPYEEVKEGSKYLECYITNGNQFSGRLHYTAGGSNFGDFFEQYDRANSRFELFDNTQSITISFEDSLGDRFITYPNITSTDNTMTSVGVFIGGGVGVKRVEVGAADSAGSGYRTLRVSN